MEKMYDNLHKMYSISKTLRFELKPVGKTLENINKKGIITEDEHRAEIFKKVKKYCDEYHKYFIDKSLTNKKLKGLSDYYKLFSINNRSEIENKKLKEAEDNLRKEISKIFTTDNHESYEKLFSKELITKNLKEIYTNNTEALKEIDEFKRFTTYFNGYNLNRRNMYTDEAVSTGIAYRLINQNLPTFISNLKIYNNYLQDNLQENINLTIKKLYNQADNVKADEMFNIDYYNEVLTQKGIENYNLIIAGKALDNGTKIKGLNEYINEYNQKNSKSIPKLTELYKQILSDKEGTSFILDSIDNDQNLVDLINEYINKLNTIIDNKAEDSLISTIKNIDKYNLNLIYYNNDISLTNLSNDIFQDWNYIKEALNTNYDLKHISKNNNKPSYLEKRKKYFKSLKEFPLQYLEDCLSQYNKENKNKVIEYFSKYIENEQLIKNIKDNFNNCHDILNCKYDNSKNLIKNDEAIFKIKNLLDSVKKFQEFIKLLIPKDNKIEKDDKFYANILKYYNELLDIVPLYNKARNYLTQKPYSTDKIKLNFKNPALLAGWDLNKETDDYGIILRKQDNYYLGIISPSNKKCFANYHDTCTSPKYYSKMEYKLLPTPNKNLPHIFFSKKGLDTFKPSSSLLEKYKKGIYKQGENFDIDFCHELIDFYKKAINKYEDWKNFDFSFKPTETYQNISEFYKDVESQGYKLNFTNYSDEFVNELVENGDLYLFQIYNKDFSEHSKGLPNLHTMYWKEIFSPENLKEKVYKLNGQAEVFYRKASVKLNETEIHYAGKAIKSKNKNSSKETTLNYDIIKDKRFTVDKFQFNVPITINFINKQQSNINAIVNRYLKYNNNVNIIGIDRGERNLLYLSVVNLDGEIIYQKSLNIIENYYNDETYKTDYHYLLDKKSEDRDNAKKNWKTISNIKELKSGYMSQIIHILIELMEKYNAIIVIEDLNKGFKNSRIKVEKQVYQKFEQMLITKLNYVINKKNKSQESGGVLNGYQLTNEFKTFQKIGKQTGVLFYIPAWCTSKIDPTTGFINMFYIKNEGVEKSKEFINKIDSIIYDKENKNFVFNIDYNKFNNRATDTQSKWKLVSHGDRIKNFINPLINNNWDYMSIDLSKEFITLFKKYNIDLSNLKESILCQNDTKFYNAKKEIDGYEGFNNLFKLMVQLRNSAINSTDPNDDYIISPVKNKDGYFYDSRKASAILPKDADGNGAYNIARKGIMLINQIKNTDDENLKFIKYNITNKEWLTFAQGKN